MNRRQDICDAIDASWRRNWTSPTIRQIAAELDLKSTQSVAHWLDVLVREGRLERKVASPRKVLYRVLR